ncbi:Txe/YoeB family addiction module toxin [Lunatibacter salilacus]|uniref:Txe/YoeB family addiction module toxin n=1 Tax=Lunatibacter salilacus TaxID=2483804 RepID=UPI00131E2D6A|nr:Txe/YoeB family addiction module toxin [Lunatibacter salilacus]
MVLTFTENAWDDYLYWQKVDKRMVGKINELIKAIKRTPFEGIGKPEPLKYDLAGYWSRRIDQEHRLVYQIIEDELLVYACRYHYDL